jgi:hypothetical protein
MAFAVTKVMLRVIAAAMVARSRSPDQRERRRRDPSMLLGRRSMNVFG